MPLFRFFLKFYFRIPKFYFGKTVCWVLKSQKTIPLFTMSSVLVCQIFGHFQFFVKFFLLSAKISKKTTNAKTLFTMSSVLVRQIFEKM